MRYISFERAQKKSTLSQHTFKACGQLLQPKETPKLKINLDFLIYFNKFSCAFPFTIHVYWSVSYTDHLNELIPTRTELLQKKQTFTDLFHSEGAICFNLYITFLKSTWKTEYFDWLE